MHWDSLGTRGKHSILWTVRTCWSSLERPSRLRSRALLVVGSSSLFMVDDVEKDETKASEFSA